MITKALGIDPIEIVAEGSDKIKSTDAKFLILHEEPSGIPEKKEKEEKELKSKRSNLKIHAEVQLLSIALSVCAVDRYTFTSGNINMFELP